MEAYKLNSLSASRLLALQDGGGALILLKVRFLPPYIRPLFFFSHPANRIHHHNEGQLASS